MFKRYLFSLPLAIAVASACPFVHADTPDADTALASRIADFGTDLVQQKNVSDADLKACAALLQAAMKLDPTQPRYPHLLIDDQSALGDVDAMIDAVKQYRTLQPNDMGAQLQLIRLQLGKMETADAKLNYTNQIIAADSVKPDVRSAVAVICAKVLYERGQNDDADKMIDNAIRLNSLNTEALRIRYNNGLQGMSDFQKTQALITMVKANPLQPEVVAELAERLADFGLVKESLDWYFNAMKLYQKSNRSIPLDLAIDYAAEQFLAERFDGADGLAIRLLQSDPNYVDALFLRLLCAKNTPLPDDDLRMHNLARKTLMRRLKIASDMANGVAATQPAPESDVPQGPVFDPQTGLPVTRPTEPTIELNVAAMPDLSAAMTKLTAAGDSAAKNQLIVAVSDMAWYAIYFDAQPDVAAAMIEDLSKLVPADNITLVRLQGWSLMAQNKPDQAQLKFDAIADKDAMAELGLIKLQPDTDAAANGRGRKLLSENASKMLGVFISDTLRERGIKVPISDKAQTVGQQMQNFPVKWMDIADKPADFYLIRGVPLEGQFDYGEPIYVNVTLQNLSEFDITVGPDGVIHNDLWMDAQIPVPAAQNFPGTAYDRITQQVVLRSRGSMSQVVRIDQGSLVKVLRDNPTAPQQIWVTVLTNPTRTGEGIGAGLGGYRVQLSKLIARAGFGIGSDTVVDGMLQDLVQGNLSKISKIDLMAEYLKEAAANPSDDRLSKVAPKFKEKLTASKIDSSASVRGYALYIAAKFADPATRTQQTQEMARSEDWSTRLLAAVLAAQSGGDSRKAILTELSNDAEPTIKQFAAAELAGDAVTATQPATAPATQP